MLKVTLYKCYCLMYLPFDHHQSHEGRCKRFSTWGTMSTRKSLDVKAFHIFWVRDAQFGFFSPLFKSIQVITWPPLVFHTLTIISFSSFHFALRQSKMTGRQRELNISSEAFPRGPEHACKGSHACTHGQNPSLTNSALIPSSCSSPLCAQLQLANPARIIHPPDCSETT